jgi:hypothetical protein
MRESRLDQLDQSLRQQLAAIDNDEAIVIEDKNGQARRGVIPYRRPTAAQKQRAWERMQAFQKKVQESLDKQGMTEDDLTRELLNDD